jgi:hypothetical protein
MSLDEKTEQLLNDEDATATAVKSLINVDDRAKGKPSKIELKTDLTENEVKIHSVLAVLNDVIDNGETKFKESCILGTLIERKERKALSKNRLSRGEIVAVAKQPDINGDMGNQMVKENMAKRLFMSQRGNQR